MTQVKFLIKYKKIYRYNTMSFHCDVCDIDLAMTSKAKHLKAQKHLKNLNYVVETKPLGRPQAPQAIPYICKVCDVKLKAASEKMHLQSKRHTENVRRSNEPKSETKDTIETKPIIKDSDDYHIYKKAFKGKDKTYSVNIKDIETPYILIESYNFDIWDNILS
jgi:hypothetical protein